MEEASLALVPAGVPRARVCPFGTLAARPGETLGRLVSVRSLRLPGPVPGQDAYSSLGRQGPSSPPPPLRSPPPSVSLNQCRGEENRRRKKPRAGLAGEERLRRWTPSWKGHTPRQAGALGLYLLGVLSLRDYD